MPATAGARILGGVERAPDGRPSAFEIVLVAAAFVGVATALATGLPAALDLPARDAILRALPSRPVEGVAVVAIDEPSLTREGPWPWPRARLAAVAEAARAAGARGIALDLLLVSPAEGDEDLAATLLGTPALVAAGLDPEAGWLLPSPSLRNVPVAQTSFDVDHDGVVRRLSTTKQRGGVSLTALPVAAAAIGLSAPPPVAVGRVLVPDFRSRPRAVPVVSASELLSGRAGRRLTGRIVFLGATAAGLGDRYVTPGSPSGTPEAGVLVHAATTACLLAGGLLAQVSPLVSGLLAAALAALVLVAARAGRRRLLRGVAALVPAVAGSALLAAGLELPLVTLSGATLVALLAVEARSARRGLEEASRLASLRAEEREARRAAVHDLKTPLTAVRGLTQLLTGFELSPAERTRVAAMVGEETDRLAGMVDSLNVAERMRLADFATVARPVDLGALARRRAEALRTAADGGVTATVEEGAIVLGDESLLGRALDNLAGNALKFSPPGSPVRVAVSRRGADVLLTVADEGPGVPEEERERVFGRFVRGRSAGSAEGLGLGLSLVHEVVTWHHGHVSVRGTGSTGSLFEVVLPGLTGGSVRKEPEPGDDPGR
jgi:signal transduction histidine kinase